MSKKIRFAIFGYGYIGKRHAKVIFQNEECELVAIVDKNDLSTPDLGHFEVPSFNSIDALFDSDIDIDVVIISTPNGLHFEHAKRVLELGKHVVVEKPMALTSLDAEKLINIAKANQCYLFPVMQNRFSPHAVWLKELVDEKILGKIYMVSVNCFWNRDQRYYYPDSWHGSLDLDGGTLYTQFLHFIDMIYWIFGDIVNIQGKFANFNHSDLTDFEDSGIVNFDFVKGGIGSLSFSTAVWDSNLESSLTIIAENGSVKIGGQYMDKVEKCIIKGHVAPDINDFNKNSSNFGNNNAEINHVLQIQNIVDTIKGRTDINIRATESRKVIELIERFYGVKQN